MKYSLYNPTLKKAKVGLLRPQNNYSKNLSLKLELCE